MLDHYTVLALTDRRFDSSLSPTDVRKAYHRSLLAHHPDKSLPRPNPSSKAAFTIDQITAAFEVLHNPKAKAEYDRLLATRSTANEVQSEKFFSGVEVVDLDDMVFHEGMSTWSRGCRCGHEDGFVVKEEDLTATTSLGELLIACKGCSLWIKVLFQAVEDDGFV